MTGVPSECPPLRNASDGAGRLGEKDPAALAEAATRRNDADRTMSTVQIDVVICTYNRAVELDQVLNALSSQVCGPTLAWRVVVVDNASTDDAAAVVARHRAQATLPVLDYVYEGEQGLTAARRRGMLETTAPWVAFVDDDNLLAPKWELWPNLGDGGLRQAAYRGGWKPA